MHEEILHDREFGRRGFRLSIRVLAVELCVNLLLEVFKLLAKRLGVPFGGEQPGQIDLAGGIAQVFQIVARNIDVSTCAAERTAAETIRRALKVGGWDI